MAGGFDLGVIGILAKPAALGGVVGKQGCLPARHRIGECQGVVGVVVVIFNVFAGDGQLGLLRVDAGVFKGRRIGVVGLLVGLQIGGQRERLVAGIGQLVVTLPEQLSLCVMEAAPARQQQHKDRQPEPTAEAYFFVFTFA